MEKQVSNEPLFQLGMMLATPGARDKFGQDVILQCMTRHVRGDCGQLDEHDKGVNADAIAHGGRILSNYEIAGDRLWIITEADRSITTALLPDEY